MDLSLNQRLEMKMRLAPQIIQSIEILQLPTLELQQRINQEMLENPVLEQLEQSDGEDLIGDAVDERATDDADFDKMEEMEERIYDYSSQAPARPKDTGRDPKLEAMQNTAARSMSLQEFLAGQLTVLDLDTRTRRIAENIVYNLDDNGYLQYTLEEIVESMPQGTTVAEAERVLRIVQSLDPPGIAARDIKECLLLQLTANGEEYELEQELIANHLDDLRMNRFPRIVKQTGRTLEEIREAAEMVCHLNPRPGSLFSSEQPHYVLPDVRIEEENGIYRVEMCDDYIPRLRVSRHYLRVLRSPDSSPEEKEYIKKKLQAARWIIDAIEQRRNTLRRIVEEVIKHQREFLERGIQFLRPLRMGVVAEAAGVHLSTVSRAISDKYVDTPRGLYEIRFFFAGRAEAASDGSDASRDSVQATVKDLVDSEDKKSPLSDVDIVSALKKKGVDISRRTVTKYRRVLNIPPSRQRVQY
ncbi:MAG: RNA polymerase factor sigma-54 [Planctomycetota bacterium]